MDIIGSIIAGIILMGLFILSVFIFFSAPGMILVMLGVLIVLGIVANEVLDIF